MVIAWWHNNNKYNNAFYYSIIVSNVVQILDHQRFGEEVDIKA